MYSEQCVILYVKFNCDNSIKLLVTIEFLQFIRNIYRYINLVPSNHVNFVSSM